MKKAGYIYKTIFPDGKYYIGKRQKSTIDKSYYGSGVYVTNYIKRHGKEKLKRKILAWAETNEELIRLEKEYIGMKFITDDMCVNRAEGGICSFNGEPWNKGKHLDDAYRKRISEGTKLGMKNISKESRKRMLERAHRPLSEETKEKLKKINEEKRTTMYSIPKEKITELYIDKNLDTETTASILDISPNVLRKVYFKKYNIKKSQALLNKMMSKKKKDKFDKEFEEKVELVKGKTIYEAKKILGLSNLNGNIDERLRPHLVEQKRLNKWYNNGKVNVRRIKCPDGFIPGRIRRKNNGDA